MLGASIRNYRDLLTHCWSYQKPLFERIRILKLNLPTVPRIGEVEVWIGIGLIKRKKTIQSILSIYFKGGLRLHVP